MTDAMVIRKTTVLNAPQARVWAAISESERFGRWFGMTLDGPFIAGQRVSGRITPTTVDAEVARLQAPHAGTPCLLFIEAIEPMTRVAFRWQPGAPPPSADVEGAERAGSAGSPGSPGSPGNNVPLLAESTRVEFLLEPVAEGTQLTIIESGFENIPLGRRARVFEGNSGGWAHQLRLVSLYLEQTAPAVAPAAR